MSTQDAMAAEFIAQLQRVEISSLDEGDKMCSICWGEFGTQLSDSGVLEHALRLPCGHMAGSECIGLWLKDAGGRNSCPQCQQVLFEIAVTRYENGQYWLGDQRIYQRLESMSEVFHSALESLSPNSWETIIQGGPQSFIDSLDRKLEMRLLREGPDGLLAKTQQSRRQRERALYDTFNNNGAFTVRRDVAGAFPAHDQELSANQANDLLSPKQEIDLFKALEVRGAFRDLWNNQARWQMWTSLRSMGWAYELGEGDRGIWKCLILGPSEDLVGGSD